MSKLPTAKMIGPGSRLAVYSDPITRKTLIGMATIARIRTIKTVWIDAAPMLEVVADMRLDGDTSAKDALFTVYLKP
jgi:hypothetical protein